MLIIYYYIFVLYPIPLEVLNSANYNKPDKLLFKYAITYGPFVQNIFYQNFFITLINQN